ncbi:MAG: MurT ligase domain-containing protein, partial [Ktedonobacterales bacterium]
RYYSHIGQWACTGCGYARPLAAVQASDVRPRGLDAVQFALTTPLGTRAVTLPLPGLYNVYNALAAAAIGCAMGVEASALDALERFHPAFGRAERIAVDGRTVQLLLAKNPTGLNEVLRALATLEGSQQVLLALNDQPADGEDVSWIWDADLERVAAIAGAVTVAGTRAYDLALRLKYAGVAPASVVPDLPSALRAALAATPQGATLYVVPTYTAMLALRAELERQGYTTHYWEQRDE